MTHVLTIELPEQVYETLLRTANRQGQRPEAVAVQWLATASESQIDDPFEQFIVEFPVLDHMFGMQRRVKALQVGPSASLGGRDVILVDYDIKHVKCAIAHGLVAKHAG